MISIEMGINLYIEKNHKGGSMNGGIVFIVLYNFNYIDNLYVNIFYITWILKWKKYIYI